MADDEERTSSDSEAEAIEAAIEDSDEDVRYSLRSRRGLEAPDDECQHLDGRGRWTSLEEVPRGLTQREDR